MIEFETLGRIELRRPDGTALLSVVSRRKPLALLAYLTLAGRGGTRRRDEVCALLWPESAEARARNALNQTVHSLRRSLGHEAIVGGRDAVGVAAGSLLCDALEMERAIRAGDPVEALALYRGELLPGLHLDGCRDYDEWLDRRRRGLASEAFQAAHLLANRHAESGDLPSAVSALRRARVIRPTDDRTVRLLLEWLERSGSRAAALDEFEQYRSHLETTYGLQPPDETRELARSLVLTGSSSPGAQRTVGRSASDRADTPPITEAPEARVVSDAPRAAERRTRRGVPRIARALAAVVVVAMLVLAWVRLSHEPTYVVKRVAVLPLADFSPDATKAFFTNAMTEELITALGRLGKPEVVGHTSVQAYRNAPAPIGDIAKRLEVDAVIEGSATWEGRTVRVNLQLVQADPERHLWAHVWEGPDSALLALQSRIAADVARRFGASPESIEKVTRQPEDARDVDTRALEAYYRGRALWKMYRPREAVDAFLEAVLVDPDWARPWAGLAHAHVLFAHTVMPPATAMRDARAHIERALELDPDLEEAQVSLGHYLMEGPLDWRASERAYLRAIQINPGYPDSYIYLGQLYMALGRYGEARVAMERAFSLDPLNPVAFTDLGKIDLVEGRTEKALEHFRKAVETYPEHPITRGQLVYALLATDRWDESIAMIREAIRDGRGLSISLGGRNPTISGWLAYALARAGHKGEASAIADSLAALAETEYVLPLGLAAAYAGLEDRESAIDWLERMEEEQSTHRLWILAYRAFDALHEEPRFEALVERLDLAGHDDHGGTGAATVAAGDR
jgi:DNA-binding SARP family transcriptional activator/TolB-like protein